MILKGFHLARGDKRGFVVLDHDGEVHSLPRALALKTEEVRDRLGDGLMLPSVAEAQGQLAARMTPVIRRHIAECRERFGNRSATLGKAKEEMTRTYRALRDELDGRQRAERDAEAKKRAARMPKGLASLWHRLSGKHRQMRQDAEAEAAATKARQERERQALIDHQRNSRAVLQAQFKDLRQGQAEQLLALRREVGRFLALTKGRGEPSPERTQQRARRPAPARGLGLER